MLTLYLILLAVMGLGVVALTMIALSYRKPSYKNKKPPVARDKPERAAPAKPPKPFKATHDPALVELGFSLLDPALAQEPAPAAANVAPTPTAVILAEKPAAPKPPFIIFYLLTAPERPFAGYELLQALLAADLRFGAKRIFHCYDKKNNDEDILFSLASAIEPGIFDIANIGEFSCHGLCLFMTPKQLRDPLAVFELMLETAQQLAEDLAGQLCNEKREPLTEAEIADYRMQLA
jgi:cell division protein ZipA